MQDDLVVVNVEPLRQGRAVGDRTGTDGEIEDSFTGTATEVQVMLQVCRLIADLAIKERDCPDLAGVEEQADRAIDRCHAEGTDLRPCSLVDRVDGEWAVGITNGAHDRIALSRSTFANLI